MAQETESDLQQAKKKKIRMTQVEHQTKWLSHGAEMIEEQVIYHERDFVNQVTMSASNEFIEQVPMIIIESNQVLPETDAPMIFVGEDVTQQICAEEVVETENDSAMLYSSPPVVYEETVKTEDNNEIKSYNDRRLGESYSQYLEDLSDIPLNDASYATFHPFPCDFCSRRFKKKANLMNHMVAHQTQRPHSCSICSSRFMRKCDLVNHQKIHTYVPNRENRDDVVEDHYTKSSYVKKKTKRTKLSNKKSALKPKSDSSINCDTSNYFKPTSYVDEDVKLLLEMTNRLHETRKTEELDQNVDKNVSSVPEYGTGSETKPYICTKCGKAFAREKALFSHSQVHAHDSRYECGKCGDRFFTLELLREHSSKKHDSSYTGETSNSSDDGANYTGDERFGSYYCSVCGLSFHKLQLMKKHKRLHIKKEEPVIAVRCNTCYKIFPSKKKLSHHLQTNSSCHSYVCMICGKHMNDSSSLHTHIKSHHENEIAQNTCQSCGKSFKDKRALQKHSLIHSTDKRFVCKKLDCKKKFHSWPRLRRHMLSHNTSKVVRCEECNEEFPDGRALINHRHSHYPDSNSRKFMCNECGKSFGSRSSQQIHNRIHTGERPYGCRYCWKAFADGGTLRKHERIHTGEKPYACVVCPRAFNQRVVLREHIRSHHSGSVSKPGYSTPVFLCTVCYVITASSEELSIHLVKHSDDNTYKNRNPQSGIRTYKKRKKVTTSDYDVDDEFDDEDFFEQKPESSYNSEESDKEIKSSPVRKSARNNRKVDNYAKFTKSCEAAMRNIKSLVDSKPVVKKAKMISTKPKQNLKSNKKLQVRTKKKSFRSTKNKMKQMNDELNVKKEETQENKKIRKPVAFQNKNTEEVLVNNSGFVCGICNLIFPTKADLLFHVPVHI